MSKLSKLLQVSDAEKRAILQHFNTTEEAFETDVKLLKDWVSKNAHLPEENDENRLRVCLLNSKMSLERAKKSIEGYYTVRAIYDNFFDMLIPNTEYFEKGRQYVLSVVMPRLTPDLNRITVYKLTDLNGEAEDAFVYYVIALMIGEIRVSHDCFISNELIMDMDGYGIKNMLKYTPSVNNKLINILNSVNLRIKAIHVLNAPPLIDRLMLMVKSVLPAKIVNRTYFHNKVEDLHKYIAKDYLPSDYGGKEKSLDQLYADWLDELRYSEKLFKDLLNVKAKGELKAKERSDEEIFGMGSEGSFKKLAID